MMDRVSIAKKPLLAGWPRGREAASGALLLLLALLAAGLTGCGEDTAPMQPEVTAEGFILIEGSSEWDTDSVSWLDEGSGLRGFAMISVALAASTNGPSHFLFSSNFSLTCTSGDCWPRGSQLFVEPRFDISNVAWSPRGPFVAFDGRTDDEPRRGIYTFQPGVGPPPRRWLTGVEPAFTHDAGLVVYVEEGRDAIRSFNPTSGGGGDERRGMSGAAHPAVAAPDTAYPQGRIAYSAADQNGQRRIFVHDRAHPEFAADIVSHPDILPGGFEGDGSNDDYPAWSPGGRYLVYRSTLTAGTFRDAIHVTRPGREPENPLRIVAAAPGRRISGLRWHRSGQYLLVVIDGDVYAYPMPEPWRSY